jgi:hypothetical protein
MIKKQLELLREEVKKNCRLVLIKVKKKWYKQILKEILMLDLNVLNSHTVKSAIALSILLTTLSAATPHIADNSIAVTESNHVLIPPIEEDIVTGYYSKPLYKPVVENKLEMRETVLKVANVKIPKSVPDKHLAIMFREAEKNKVPLKIAMRLVYSESSFDKTSVSHKGAKGYMQLMPATRKIYVDKLNIADKKDTETNIIIGYAYLGDLFKQYKRRNISDKAAWRLTLASYNAGPGNVQKSGGVPSYCEKYVTKIMGNHPLN